MGNLPGSTVTKLVSVPVTWTVVTVLNAVTLTVDVAVTKGGVTVVVAVRGAGQTVVRKVKPVNEVMVVRRIGLTETRPVEVTQTCELKTVVCAAAKP